MWYICVGMTTGIRFQNTDKKSYSYGLFDRASSSWKNVKCQLDATRSFYWCILSSTCYRCIRPSSGASDVKLQHTVFCTEFVDGRWSWEPLRRLCGRCRATQSHGTVRTIHTTSAAALKPTVHPQTQCRKPYAAPDDGRMCPKHVELRIPQ